MIEYNSAIAYQKVSKRGRRPAADVGRKFTLMWPNHEVAYVSFDPTREFPRNRRGPQYATNAFGACSSSSPTVNKRELNAWWGHRSVPDVRRAYLALPRATGLSTALRCQFSAWVSRFRIVIGCGKSNFAELKWQNINYFENEFERSAPEERSGWLEGIGLKNPDNTSEGELPKSWMIRNGIRILAKGCGMDDERPFNEAVATALHRRLLSEGEFVPYTVERMFDGPVCLCDDFL